MEPVPPQTELLERRLRDIAALSTLPAVWIDADGIRIAESLAAALFGCITPEFVLVSLNTAPHSEPVTVAQVARSKTSDAFADRWHDDVKRWARHHDPDELMVLPAASCDGKNGGDPRIEVKVSARPIGLDSEWGTLAAGFASDRVLDPTDFLLMNVAATQAATAARNVHLMRSLQESVEHRTECEVRERRAREEVEALQGVALNLAAELDLEDLIQGITDYATQLSGAQFGAFFYNHRDETGESFLLFSLSGASRKDFEKFGNPRNTKIFEPTFRGDGIIRLDDVMADPRYGQMAPHYGMPKGHLPVRSYLAVPVRVRGGEVFGGLFLGHAEPGVFTERHERLVAGIAAQAAVVIDNARLYGTAREEIAIRKEHEEHLRLLLDELNHRVKNTLATIQSIARQTLTGRSPIEQERQEFQSRLASLSRVHDLLTADNWEGSDLREITRSALAPFSAAGDEGRIRIGGPSVNLTPRMALTLGMAIHELSTNAMKHGSLSVPAGIVEVAWDVLEANGGQRLAFGWIESGGPLVSAPERRGFGTLMLERILKHDLGGKVSLAFAPEGLAFRCEIRLPVPAPGQAA